MPALMGSIPKDINFNLVMEKEKNKDGEVNHENDDDDDDDDDDSETHAEEGYEEDEEEAAVEEGGKPNFEVKLEGKELEVGPQFSLKEQLDKDKDDESLRRWKEQLVGDVDLNAVGGTSLSLSSPSVPNCESKEPEVYIQSLSIVCKNRPDLVFAIPLTIDSKSSLFALKEGTPYHLKFSFVVSSNIVSGLKYKHTVWKAGIKVDNTEIMLGTFSPQQESYSYELEEETTPKGILARGTYSARSKFLDDDRKCYLDFSYKFDINKHWD